MAGWRLCFGFFFSSCCLFVFGYWLFSPVLFYCMWISGWIFVRCAFCVLALSVNACVSVYVVSGADVTAAECCISLHSPIQNHTHKHVSIYAKCSSRGSCIFWIFSKRLNNEAVVYWTANESNDIAPSLPHSLVQLTRTQTHTHAMLTLTGSEQTTKCNSKPYSRATERIHTAQRKHIHSLIHFTDTESSRIFFPSITISNQIEPNTFYLAPFYYINNKSASKPGIFFLINTVNASLICLRPIFPVASCVFIPFSKCKRKLFLRAFIFRLMN